MFNTMNAGSEDERMRITHDGKVGIGTTNPTDALHIVGDGLRIAYDTWAANGYQIRMDSSTAMLRLSYMSGETIYKQIMQWNYGSADVSILSGSLDVKGNVSGSSTSTGSFGDGRFAGNVGIGTTAPIGQLQVDDPYDNGVPAFYIAHASTNNLYGFSMQLLEGDNPTTAGMDFRRHSNSVTGVSQMYFERDGGNVGIGTTGPLEKLHVASGSVLVTGAGEGYAFEAGAAANTLDDYEEGTWTGVVTDHTRPMAMSATTGYYTKVGNLVTVTGHFNTTSLDGGSGNATGNIVITGLPFTVANNAAAYSAVSSGYADGFNLAAAGQTVGFYGAINTTNASLTVWDATTGTTSMQASEWSADGSLMIGFSYRAA
jgi:hypothetical protein